MPKRGGLGQRGLDLLISASPGAGDKSAAEEKSVSKEKSSEKKNSKTSGKRTVKAGTKNTSKSSTAAKSTGKDSGKNAGTAKKGLKGNADKNAKGSKVRSQSVAETEKTTSNTANANTVSANADIQLTNSMGAEVIDAVLPGVQNEPLELPIELVEPNRGQPRKNFDDDALQELADSIIGSEGGSIMNMSAAELLELLS